MEYTLEELVLVEQFASLFFSAYEINIMLGKGLENQTPFYVHYKRGQLMADAEIRLSIFTMAKNGIGPAQAEAIKLMNALKINEAM